KNPNYHGPRRGHIGEYTFVESRDPWLQVQRGHAAYTPDGAPPTPSQVAASIRRYGPSSPVARAGHQRVFVNPSSALLFVVVHPRAGPLTNPLVRRAINDAIDRRALAATWGPGVAIVTDQYLPPGVPGFPGNGHAFPLAHPNLAAARMLMRRAHVALPMHATLLTATDPAAAARAAILARDVKRIGITLTTHAVPYATLVQA